MEEGCRTEYSEGIAMARELSEYLEGTAEEFEKWSCSIDHGILWKNKRVPPSLEIFTKKVSLKIFFNKDIEMSWDMLYRQEKIC
jgi:hypothetical protein